MGSKSATAEPLSKDEESSGTSTVRESAKERRTISLRPKPAPEPQPAPEAIEKPQQPESPVKEAPEPQLQATPSTFAEAMFGSRLQAVDDPANLRSDGTLPVHEFPMSKAFAGPSPDDVVLSAQSKGIRM
ncbi:MAG: hypothetical protein INR71_05045 [Terriglobus roseus]|nr:hypothetical protein [Terriglobus roseus]